MLKRAHGHVTALAEGVTLKALYLDMEDAALWFGSYADGSPALFAADGFGSTETLSINLSAYLDPENVLGDNEVFVKNYAEHEGVADALIATGLFFRRGGVTFGPWDSTADILKFDPNHLKEAA